MAGGHAEKHFRDRLGPLESVFRQSLAESVKLITSMACLIAGIVVVIFLAGIISGAISGAVYRHLLRTGHTHPVNGQIISFVVTFVAILTTVVVAGWIFVSNFRFER